MKERPIIFSGPMVRAILAGKKTQTRRWVARPERFSDGGHPCPYGVPGDRLWVREGWTVDDSLDGVVPRQLEFQGRRPIRIHYLADGNKPDGFGKGRPSIFMPRDASRATMVITATAVQRLNDISTADIAAEGVSNRETFIALWDALCGDGSWALNPWVWAISFKVVQPAVSK